MTDVAEGNKHPILKFLSNGSGILTFRMATIALATCTFALVAYEGERMNTKLDSIDVIDARVDVHAARLDTLDAANLALWSALHGNATRLDDHEHRISILEGARERH